jgi:hypothetical protein
MNAQAIAVPLAQNTCTSGVLCWFEAHPGTAAWLQGAGTLIALIAAVIAYIGYRSEGFRPRIRAWCNPDGHLAVFLLTNLGRASGAVDDMLVGKVKPWPRRALKGGDRPDIRPHRGSQAPPCSIGPGESMRLLLTAGSSEFTEKSLRIAVVLGDDVKMTRVKQLRNGRINEDQFADSAPQAQPTSQPQDDTSVADPAWDVMRRELSDLVDLYSSGHLSRIDLWVGRYRSLRRAQRAEQRQDTSGRSTD